MVASSSTMGQPDPRITCVLLSDAVGCMGPQGIPVLLTPHERSRSISPTEPRRFRNRADSIVTWRALSVAECEGAGRAEVGQEATLNQRVAGSSPRRAADPRAVRELCGDGCGQGPMPPQGNPWGAVASLEELLSRGSQVRLLPGAPNPSITFRVLPAGADRVCALTGGV